jgi:hypothetical protein
VLAEKVASICFEAPRTLVAEPMESARKELWIIGLLFQKATTVHVTKGPSPFPEFRLSIVEIFIHRTGKIVINNLWGSLHVSKNWKECISTP